MSPDLTIKAAHKLAVLARKKIERDLPGIFVYIYVCVCVYVYIYVNTFVCLFVYISIKMIMYMRELICTPRYMDI
jgi:divalent metal cation (Fe/Co/Zn/Cd) transporter